MRYALKKERAQLFSPAAMISLKLDIAGCNDAAVMRRAIREVLRANSLMCTHIVISPEGDAYFESLDEPNCPILIKHEEWRQLLAESERRPFDLAEGELARFFIIPGAPMQLLICAHRLIGAGLSLMQLAGDIMAALNGEVIEPRGIELCDPEQLPGALPLSVQLNIRMVNLRWQFGKRVFDFRDMKRLNDVYPQSDATIHKRVIDHSGDPLRICASAASALMSLSGGAESGVTLIYEGGKACLGDFSREIVIGDTYDSEYGVRRNVDLLMTELGSLLQDTDKLNYSTKYLSSFMPTLIDASYFAAYDGYGDPIARRLSQMRGMSDRARRVEIHMPPTDALLRVSGECSIVGCAVIPPLSPGARRTLGIAILPDRATLILRTPADDQIHDSREVLSAIADAICGEG